MFTQHTRSICVTALALIVLCLGLITTGCSKQSPAAPELDTTNIITDEVAVSVAGLIAEDNGGILDQINQTFELADVQSMTTLGKEAVSEWTTTRDANYDSVAGIWSVITERERGAPGDSIYAYLMRNREVQFLNEDGTPQKRWLIEGDTARTILVKILDGEGIYINPRVNHELKTIAGDFNVVDVHTETVTLNGTFQKSAIDTITTKWGTKTLDHAIDLTYTDIVGPRGSRRKLDQKVSGMLTGTYTATVTKETPKGTITENIEYEINVDLSEEEVDIKLGGRRFKANAKSGKITE